MYRLVEIGRYFSVTVTSKGNSNNNSPIASDTSVETITCAKAIQELLDVRDRLKVIPELNYNDVDVMIEDLCCM